MIKQMLNNTTLLQFITLGILMSLDFFTGIMKAKRKNNITSRQMGDGFTKKAVQFLIAISFFVASFVASQNNDLQSYSAMFFVLFNGYTIGVIAKEIISIRENLKSIGALDDNKQVDALIDLVEKVAGIEDEK